MLADRDEPVRTRTEAARRRPARPTRSRALAAAAGYDDPERWWEDVVESRRDGAGPFEAIAEAMAALRAGAGPAPTSRREERREAHMRTVLRGARSSRGIERIAVVCGAWHVPALTAPLPTATADAALLQGAAQGQGRADLGAVDPRPAGLLAGYGAGVALARLVPPPVHHPGPDGRALADPGRRACCAQEDLPVSSAHVIEAVRLAEALAALRGRAGRAGEVTEATRAVLCDGDEVRAGAGPPPAGRRRAARRGAGRGARSAAGRGPGARCSSGCG